MECLSLHWLHLLQEHEDEFSHTVMHGKKIQKALPPAGRVFAQPPRPVAGRGSHSGLLLQDYFSEIMSCQGKSVIKQNLLLCLRGF